MDDKNLKIALCIHYFPVVNGEGVEAAVEAAAEMAKSARPDGPGRVVFMNGDIWERHYLTWRGRKCCHIFGTGVEPIADGWEWRKAE